MALNPHPDTVEECHVLIDRLRERLRENDPSSPGYYINNYVEDPDIPQYFSNPFRTQRQHFLPPVPMPLRNWGVEGIIPIRVTNNDGNQNHVFYSIIVPTGFPICVASGLISQSENTIAGHLGRFDTMADLHRQGSRQLAIGPASYYEALDVPQGHVDWSNNSWKIHSNLLDPTTTLAIHDVPVDDETQEGFRAPGEGPAQPGGVLSRPLPEQMLSFGIPGVYLARVIGADRSLTWTLHVPPGFPITRWCGFISNNWSTMATSHSSRCPCCRNDRHPITYKITGWMYSRMEYQFTKISTERINWANHILQAERARRLGTVVGTYDVPAKPSLFTPAWNTLQRNLECYMITGMQEGLYYDDVSSYNQERSLYIRPHEALATNNIPPFAYLWSQVSNQQLIPPGANFLPYSGPPPDPPIRHDYPGPWGDWNRGQRMVWLRARLTLAQYQEDGLDAPPFPQPGATPQPTNPPPALVNPQSP